MAGIAPAETGWRFATIGTGVLLAGLVVHGGTFFFVSLDLTRSSGGCSAGLGVIVGLVVWAGLRKKEPT
ncbi:hypothetical protein GCM10020220_104180 [Nonomuraea rubra]